MAYFTKLKGILLCTFMVTKETGSFGKQSIVADSKNFEWDEFKVNYIILA